jgi:hypothetical protein
MNESKYLNHSIDKSFSIQNNHIKQEKYEARYLANKEKLFESKYPEHNHLSSKIFKMLGTHTKEALGRRLEDPIELLGEEHGKILKNHEAKFQKKKDKINFLIHLRKNFSPEFSMIPLAKQLINPTSKMSSFKIEQIVKTKNRKKNKKTRNTRNLNENQFLAMMNSTKKLNQKKKTTYNTKLKRKHNVKRKLFLSNDLCGKIGKMMTTRREQRKEGRGFQEKLRFREKTSDLDSRLFLKGVVSFSHKKRNSLKDARFSTFRNDGNSLNPDYLNW